MTDLEAIIWIIPLILLAIYETYHFGYGKGKHDEMEKWHGWVGENWGSLIMGDAKVVLNTEKIINDLKEA